jgi:hypothetical protein
MRIYLILAAIVAVFIACVYYVGFSNGRYQCQGQVVENNTQMQNEIIKIQGIINAETYRRGVADIRRSLYEKYTIAE